MPGCSHEKEYLAMTEENYISLAIDELSSADTLDMNAFVDHYF